MQDARLDFLADEFHDFVRSVLDNPGIHSRYYDDVRRLLDMVIPHTSVENDRGVQWERIQSHCQNLIFKLNQDNRPQTRNLPIPDCLRILTREPAHDPVVQNRHMERKRNSLRQMALAAHTLLSDRNSAHLQLRRR